MQREPSTPTLAELDDHRLIVLVAGAPGQHPAATVLLLRHLEWMRRRIAIDGAKHGLSLADIEDAQQSLSHEIVQHAIDSFRPLMPESGRGQSFKSFLRHVLEKRLLNFVREVRRVERHFDRSVDVYSFLEMGHASTAAYSSRRPCEAREPVQIAERYEFFERLDAVLRKLPATEQLLWHLAVTGCPIDQIARILKVGYQTAKFRRQRLLAKIRRQLADHLPFLDND